MRVNIIVTKPTGECDTLAFEHPTEITVGRSSSCQCRLDSDPLISRIHAALLLDPPTLRITDLGSTNGVFVNNARLGDLGSGTTAELRDGDAVRLGMTLLQIEVADPSDESDAATSTSGRAITATAPTVPGYAVTRLLGRGGMGEVYLARRLASGEKVALKLLNCAKEVDRKRIDAFNREIEVTKSVNHPNIVRFLDSGLTEAGSLYLALEYVSGGDLGAHILKHAGRRLPITAAYTIVRQAAAGMAHAHANGIVHRDLKPQNILLELGAGKTVAKISDLGLARNFEDLGFAISGSALSGGGTMPYMPPEQLASFRDVKPSGDVFSLGASFYEMLCGQTPYNFRHDSDATRIIANCDIVPVEERLPGLTESLVVIIDRCLCREPEERYQNCGEMLDALMNVTI